MSDKKRKSIEYALSHGISMVENLTFQPTKGERGITKRTGPSSWEEPLGPDLARNGEIPSLTRIIRFLWEDSSVRFSDDSLVAKLNL